jgi:hypothetical protein
MRQNRPMRRPIDVVAVERIEGCGITVTFSDGTCASYPAEELEALRPYREQASERGTAAPGWKIALRITWTRRF